MPDVSKLLDYCSLFRKKAGLIKAPPAIINTFSEWAVSMFCKKLVEGYLIPRSLSELEQRKVGGKQTIAAHKKAEDIKQKWNRLNDFLNTYQSRYKTLDKLVSSNKFVINIPSFNTSKDGITGLSGFVDISKAAALLLSIEKQENGSIRFFISINGNEIENSILSQADHTDDRLEPLLLKYEERIKAICWEFISFISDDYKPTQEQNIIEIKQLIAFCNANIKPNYTTSQKFTFPISSVFSPGMKNMLTAIKDIEVITIFASNKIDQDALYNREEWKGIFAENVSAHTSGDRRVLHLGTIGVGRIVKEDLNNIMSEPARSKFEILKSMLDEIKTTVRHETEHLFQTFTGFMTGTRAGLPSKKLREYGYQEYGVATNNLEAPQLQHSLRDIEFYTDLGDSVSSYKRMIASIPLYLQSNFLRSWIALDPMITPKTVSDIIEFRENRPINDQQRSLINEAFRTLHSHRGFFDKLQGYNKPKYQKAVKEFLKAIGH